MFPRDEPRSAGASELFGSASEFGGGEGGWVVAEEGVPGKEGLGTGMGIAEPARCAYVCVCLCVREADELHRHCEQQW